MQTGYSPTTYEQLLDRYDWAEKHINKFNVIHREFRDAHPISVSTKTHPDTGDVTYYVDQVPAVPSSLPMIAGDALHSLRGVLDYLACGLVAVVGPDTKFPIAHTAKDYKPLCDRVVKGLGKEAREALDRIRPYQGGNLLLWQLHKLNIIDKHRLLLAVCVISPAQRLAPDEMATQEKSGPEQIVFRLGPNGTGILKESKTPPVALHTGKELLTLSAAEAQKHMGFYFAVGLNEPGLAEGIPLNMLLTFIFNEVGFTIAKLAPYLLKLIQGINHLAPPDEASMFLPSEVRS